MFSLEHLEERLGLDTVVALEHLLDPTPIVLIERVQAGPPVAPEIEEAVVELALDQPACRLNAIILQLPIP
jgi:hypothetical protein